MTRENRLNVIFLVAFLVISLPGAAILFLKKLDPEARLMYMPSSVRKSIGYMVPQVTAPDVVRSYPPVTMAWVERQAIRFTGNMPHRIEEAGGRLRPLISQDRLVELLAVEPDTRIVSLLIWQPVDTDSAVSEGEILAVERVSLPTEVVKDLLAEGYTRPPKAATLVRLRYPPSAKTVPLEWQSDGRRQSDQIAIPTAAGADSGVTAARTSGR